MQDTSNSPVSILASFFSKSNTQPELCLITGSIGAGKTSWCLELAYQARLAGLSPRGLVSPAVFEMDEKIGIDLIDIESQQRSRLATLKSKVRSALLVAKILKQPNGDSNPVFLNGQMRFLRILMAANC